MLISLLLDHRGYYLHQHSVRGALKAVWVHAARTDAHKELLGSIGGVVSRHFLIGDYSQCGGVR